MTENNGPIKGGEVNQLFGKLLNWSKILPPRERAMLVVVLRAAAESKYDVEPLVTFHDALKEALDKLTGLDLAPAGNWILEP